MAHVVDIEAVVRLANVVASGAMTRAQAIEVLEAMAVDDPNIQELSEAEIRAAVGGARREMGR